MDAGDSRCRSRSCCCRLSPATCCLSPAVVLCVLCASAVDFAVAVVVVASSALRKMSLFACAPFISDIYLHPGHSHGMVLSDFCVRIKSGSSSLGRVTAAKRLDRLDGLVDSTYGSGHCRERAGPARGR